MNLPRSIINGNCKTNRFRQPIKVKVLSSRHSFGYVMRSLSGELIDSHVGILPANYEWTKETGELFALATVFHRLNCDDMQRYRVSLICSSLPFEGSREWRQAA